MSDVIAINIVRISETEHRTICVKKGSPIVTAYKDDTKNMWTIVNVPFSENDEVLNNDCFLVTKDQVLFLATAKGYIYRSGAAGLTWQVIDDSLCFNAEYQLITESCDRIIAVNKNGIIFSDDHGFTWDKMPKIEWQSVNNGITFSGA